MNAIRSAVFSVTLLSTALALPAHADTHGGAAPGIIIDCLHPVLPKQHEVSRLLDQHNAGQVYVSRARLMGEARRACLRAGAAQVRMVAIDQSGLSRLAVARHGEDRIAANRPVVE